ncbi:MAG TPA: glycosyltransferase [Methyloceanibacter sp.]|jgi:exo-beta-1,3-glucanase (GH17 family)/cellulose synthase/poly-beta-1,6-N-acetylglucosamine synthase-like glycosyltransferase|nr:glycosyltransferase [Methyloceanibacter sp.]
MRNALVAVVVALATALHASVWLLMHEQVSPPNANGALPSISFSPINPKHDGESDKTSEAQIRSDLAAIAPYTRSVRTYSVSNGLDRVPPLAAEVGLRVTLGAWINEWEEQNEREIESAIALAKEYRNIDSVIVGNEAVFRAQELHQGNPEYNADHTVQDLIAKIQRVKREVRVPVTTAEVPNVWLEYPELASAVDYLAVHILPYWEGIPGSRAVDHALNGYERLRQAYPGKRIVIAEFGWPSAGLNRKDAVPSPLTQADVVRDFVARADAMGIDYSIVEAFDQPWKTAEGSVGPYWGIFNADRQPKFSFAGTVEEPNFLLKVIAALGIGILLSIPVFAIPRVTLAQAGVLALTAQAIGAWSANVVDYWVTHYFVLGSQIALFAGAGLLVPLIMIMKRRIEELAAILFGAKPRRLLARGGGLPEKLPFVSIHIPAYREPPEMLRQTLDSVAQLDWPNFECVVVINNTPDPAFWEPIEDHCRLLGPRFKFVRADRLEGFKAGALRLALEHTAPEAEIIGVLDADYVVSSEWLKDLVPAFADPAVGLVQAPQDHRDASRSIMQVAMNREYAGFFDIGMVERNEANAIIVHGTMCLIRREALASAGGWSSDTIVEDTDLGLSLLERGWRAHYTQTRYGWGLLPCDFAAYKRQRHRWAYGGVQLVKKHWRAFLPGASRLTPQQRSQYLFGWLTWLGAEALGVLIAILNLLWMPLVAFLGIAVPEAVLTLPVLATFAVTLLHFMVLYRTRVQAPLFASLGAALSAMALQFTVGRAVADGVIKDGLPFERTAKGGASRWGKAFPALWEAVLGSLLVLGSLTLYVTNDQRVYEISVFSAVLLVQSLPFLAAVALALIERTPFNEFATWRRVVSLSTYLPRLPRGPAPTAGPPGGGNVGVVP